MSETQAPPPPDPAAAERNARHARDLRELSELTMGLARRAAAAATEALDPNLRRHSPFAEEGPKDPTLPFNRLATQVRKIIELEVTLAAGQIPRSSREPEIFEDPDIATLREALHAGANARDAVTRTMLRQQIDAQIEMEFLYSDTPPDYFDMFRRVMMGLQLDINLYTLPEPVRAIFERGGPPCLHAPEPDARKPPH